MPSKLRKAIGALKDQTNIGIAKVSTTSNLEIAILKATSHEEVLVEDRYVKEILLLTSSNKVYAVACARAISKHIGHTRNWIVALKSLLIVLRVFQDSDPYFPKEVLMSMKHGGKILNLSSFRDDSNSSPWDYTAFVRTIALYLSARLECFITGKLQRRMVMKDRDKFHYQPHRQRYNEHVRDMKPAILIDRITSWQRLLEKEIVTRPTGVAKNNRLVQISMYTIVRESFDIYCDIADSLALLLDSFFNLPHQCCINAFEACSRSAPQFEELTTFYDMCKEIGVGRLSEYPTVQKISDELMDTLQEFLKDQSPFPTIKPQTSPQLCLPPPALRNGYSPSSFNQWGHSDTSEQFRSELRDGQRTMSLEDLISVTELGTSPSYSIDKERISAQLQSSSVEDFLSLDIPGTSPGFSIDQEEYSKKASSVDDMLSVHTAATSPSASIDQRNNSVFDLLSFDDTVQTQVANQPSGSGQEGASRDEWELVLVETASNISSMQNCIANESGFPNDLFNQASMSYYQSNYNNHLLTLGNEQSIIPFPAADPFANFPIF